MKSYDFIGIPEIQNLKAFFTLTKVLFKTVMFLIEIVSIMDFERLLLRKILKGFEWGLHRQSTPPLP